MIFVCCAIKLLRSTFQLPSLALSLSTPLRGMESLYSHPECPGFRLSEDLGTAPCASLLSTQCLEGCFHPPAGWKWCFGSQYSPTVSHCKPISTISSAGSCDGCLHSLHLFKWDQSPPVVNFCITLTGSFLTIPLQYLLFPNFLCFHILLHMCHSTALSCFRAPWGSWLWYRTCCICRREPGCDGHTDRNFCLFSP